MKPRPLGLLALPMILALVSPAMAADEKKTTKAKSTEAQGQARDASRNPANGRGAPMSDRVFDGAKARHPDAVDARNVPKISAAEREREQRKPGNQLPANFKKKTKEPPSPVTARDTRKKTTKK